MIVKSQSNKQIKAIKYLKSIQRKMIQYQIVHEYLPVGAVINDLKMIKFATALLIYVFPLAHVSVPII